MDKWYDISIGEDGSNGWTVYINRSPWFRLHSNLGSAKNMARDLVSSLLEFAGEEGKHESQDLPRVGAKVQVLLKDGRVETGSLILYRGNLLWFVDGVGIVDDECVLGWREIS